MAQPPGHVTGVGGVFIKSKDPKALLAWYRDVLGLEMKPWGGAAIPLDAPGHPPVVVWSPFSATTDYMAPSTQWDMSFEIPTRLYQQSICIMREKRVTVIE